MGIPEIIHRSVNPMCYALDENRVFICVYADKDVTSVDIIAEDPFINELHRKPYWYGTRMSMKIYKELDRKNIWSIILEPKYKRLKYYFEYEADRRYCLFENRICSCDDIHRTSKQYFKFPWLNRGDIIAPPKWAEKTVWYQIMPDRYSRCSDFENDGRFRDWGDMSRSRHNDIYGGSVRGVIEKLSYIKDLGIGGIYFTPIFKSNTNHKYNTFDYWQIDPDFGTDEDIIELVEKAHKMGIRIMLDAVFNHSGGEFFAWKDVIEKGSRSEYFDWFFVNDEKGLNRPEFSTEDGRFYSFSFWSLMPKLNTNNPQVIKYFTDLTLHWVRDWDIDGIRFDVGDEVSHVFLRHLNEALKEEKQDIFLLGEIWTDSVGWVNGYEYDSVMNYPFSSVIGDLWNNRTIDSEEFMHMVNHCHTMYARQSVNVMFNFLDTHDTARVFESCRTKAELIQRLALLLMMPGSPCIYYGTELPMKGKRFPYNRSCMPWDDIESGRYSRFISKVSSLVKLRNSFDHIDCAEIRFIIHQDRPRLIDFYNGRVRVCINAQDDDMPFAPDGETVFSERCKKGVLKSGGTLILLC